MSLPPPSVAEVEAPLPPPPPQFNRPVGEPPAPRELPKTFEECEERARQAANGQIEKAQLWATLANAHAMNKAADKLDALNEFLGVYDETEEDDQEDGEEPLNPRLADVIAEGLMNAASVVKDDILSSALVQQILIKAREAANSPS